VFLGLLDVGRAGALFGLLGVEGNFVAFMQFGEGDADERRAVEKDILVAAVRGDETKTLFAVKSLDYSCHMFVCLRIISAN